MYKDLCILNDPDKYKRRKLFEVLESFGFRSAYFHKGLIDKINDMGVFFWVDFNPRLDKPLIKDCPIRPTTLVETIPTIDEFLYKFSFDVGDEIGYLGSEWKIIKKYWNREVGTAEYDLKQTNSSFFWNSKTLHGVPSEDLLGRGEGSNTNIERNMVVKFLKNGDLYKVLEENCEMKHPETREWIQCVIYQQYKKLVDGEYQDVSDPKIFVRERKEFLEQFLLALDF